MKEIVNIVLIGKPKTGKTTLMNNVANDFSTPELHKTNNSFNLRLYLTEDRDKIPVEVRFWDITSKPCFHSIVALPIKKADIIFYISNDRFRVEEYIEYKALIDNYIKEECEVFYLENKRDDNNNLSQVLNFKHTYELNILNKENCINFVNDIIFNLLENRYKKKIRNKNNSSPNPNNSINEPLLQNKKTKSFLSRLGKKLKVLFCCSVND